MPYATPFAYDGLENGIWRDGGVLVVHRKASLPSACVKCNAPTDRTLRRKLAWHPGWVYLLIVAPGIVVYAIVALIIRQQATLEVPLCDRHYSRRRRLLIIAWVTALSGTAAVVAGLLMLNLPDPSPSILPGGILLLVAGLVLGVVVSPVVKPRRIDTQYVWLKGVCNEYLAPLQPVERR